MPHAENPLRATLQCFPISNKFFTTLHLFIDSYFMEGKMHGANQ